MIYDFRRRARPFREERIEVFTDGNDDYTYVLKSFFPWSISMVHFVMSCNHSLEALYIFKSSARRRSLSSIFTNLFK